MAYKTYTRELIAAFTGRPVASFPETFIASSAIPQAVLLFKIGTCIFDPEKLTPDQQQMVDFAIISMADAIHLTAPYQSAKASPFNSESIGSYSYSKVAAAAQKGLETGIMWFDMAVGQLSVCDRASGDFQRGGIEMFEHDGTFVTGHVSGNVEYLSPVDRRLSANFGFNLDPAPGLQTREPSLFDADVVPASWIEDPPGSGLYTQGV